MTKEAAYQAFWSGFGLTAYEENAVPDNAQMPYITYEGVVDAFGGEVPAAVNIWYREKNWTDINRKAAAVSERISMGGCIEPCDGGAIWIKRGTPFARRAGDDSDDMIKRIIINVTTEYFTLN